jgi:hypothetical protein
LPKVCDFQKENNTMGYRFKNPQEIYRGKDLKIHRKSIDGFLFFVISISGGFYSWRP